MKFQLITTWQVRKSSQCVARDYAEAPHLYLLASAQGHAAAQNNLGGMFERGRGAQDASEAIHLHSFAAVQGIGANLKTWLLAWHAIKTTERQNLAWEKEAVSGGVYCLLCSIQLDMH